MVPVFQLGLTKLGLTKPGLTKQVARASDAGMMRFVPALCLFLIAMTGVAEAQNVPRSAVCTPENATATSVAKVAADPTTWLGQCVAVDGLYVNERVYADADAIYGVNANFVGGFIDGMQPLPGAWRGTFVGRVTDCAVAEATLLNGQLRGPGINQNGRTLGCITPRGPMLMFMTGSNLKASGLKRRLPGAKGGDLTAATADWAHYKPMMDIAASFVDAMRSDSDADLARVLGNGYRAMELRMGADTAFSQLKQSKTPQVNLFRYPDPLEGVAAGEACYCLKANCEKLWPIDGRDADNQPGRPYACLRIQGASIDETWRYRLDTSNDVAGLVEPK